MAFSSSKHQDGAVVALNLKFDGGLNLASAPANIADNELVRAFNMIYDAQTGYPMTRPGASCCMAATCNGSNPILKGYYYEKSSAVKYHVAACGGKLYYRSGTSLDAWTEIGSLADSSTVPSFLTFNSKLLIADGAQNIKTWDGTTYSALSDGLYATAISTIKGRVVVNSNNSPDLVTLSGPNDETKWNTSTEGAIAVRAGFGDNMAVNGFAVFDDDLIISKRGDSEKRFYRLNTADATATNWYVKQLTANNCAQNGNSIISAFNNVFFVDDNGFKTLKGVTEYGDLQVDPIGVKVNSSIRNLSCDEVSYLPLYSSIWCLVGDRVFCYHRIIGDNGVINDAFTDLAFQFGRVRSIYQAGDYVYLCGNDGYLYKLNENLTTDATSTSTTESFASGIKSREFVFPSQGILKKTQWYFHYLESGTAIYSAITPNGETILNTFTISGSGVDIADMTDHIADYTDDISTLGGGSDSFETTRNRVRGQTIQLCLTIPSGRVGIEGVKADVAMVGA